MGPLTSIPNPNDRSPKNRVLRAASKLFATHGFCGTSVRQIASRARVNEVTIIRLFSSKRALYEQVLENKLGRTPTADSSLLPASEREQLLHSLADELQQTFDPELTRLLIFAALEDPRAIRKWVSPRMERYYELVGSYLEKLMASGAIRSANPRLMAQALVALILYDRISNDILADRPIPVDELRRHTASLVEIWLHGVAEQMSFQ